MNKEITPGAIFSATYPIAGQDVNYFREALGRTIIVKSVGYATEFQLKKTKDRAILWRNHQVVGHCKDTIIKIGDFVNIDGGGSFFRTDGFNELSVLNTLNRLENNIPSFILKDSTYASKDSAKHLINKYGLNESSADDTHKYKIDKSNLGKDEDKKVLTDKGSLSKPNTLLDNKGNKPKSKKSTKVISVSNNIVRIEEYKEVQEHQITARVSEEPYVEAAIRTLLEVRYERPSAKDDLII